MIFTKRQVYEGERLPWGYGRAYYLPQTDAMVCYPVPFNLVVRWLRNLYYWLATPRIPYKELYEGLQKHYEESRMKYWKLFHEHEALIELFGRSQYLASQNEKSEKDSNESRGGKNVE